MIYSFKNKKTGQIKDVSMSMKDYAPYKGESGKEDCWERIYNLPQVNMGNTRTDPWDNGSFADKTGNMKGSYGDILDYSKELSEKRAEKSDTGEDPVKRKHFDKFEKEVGKKHTQDRAQKIETDFAKVEF